MDQMSDRYYRPSGAVPVLGTLTMLLAGMAAALVAGFVGAAVNRWFAYVIVLIAVAFGYGAFVGWAVRISAKICHVRHPGFTRFVALAVGLFSVYSAWVWYMWAWWNPAVAKDVSLFMKLFSQPGLIFRAMQGIAGQGAWELFGWMPKGAMLYSIWALEALLYILLAVAVSVNESLTYCEDCRRWTKQNEKLGHMPFTDFDELRTALEAENYDILDALRSQPCDMDNRLDIGTSTCQTCTETSFLTVSHVTVSDDGEGGQTENSEPVVQHLIVPREIAERMTFAVLPKPDAETPESDDAAGETEPPLA